MAATNPTRVELQNRFFIAAPQAQRRAIVWSLTLFLVTIVIAGLILNRVFPLEEIDWGQVTRHAKKSVGGHAWDMVLFAVIIIVSLAQFIYINRARRLERMILTESEIRYQSALPKTLQFLMSEWSAKWSEINRAYFRKKTGGYGPGSIELVLLTYRGEECKLRPYLWVEPKGMKPQTPWEALRQVQRMKPPELRHAVLETAVVQFMRARLPRLETETSWDKVAFPFALETNPHALAILGLCAALMIYGVYDFAMNAETYASQPPYGFFAMLGLLAAMVAGKWLRGGEVPFSERMGLAVVLGAVLGAALYPGLLRLNQLTDKAGLQTYVYQLQGDGSLAPLRKGPPVVAFPRYADYWTSFSAGSLHEFRLRKGGLGFYQIDMAPINDAMRQYYRDQQ